MKRLKRLCDQMLQLGAHEAASLPATELVCRDSFAARCKAPYRCPNYGLSPSCPPHAPSPQTFRALLARSQWLVAYSIQAPLATLAGPGRVEINRRIHLLAAKGEDLAKSMGIVSARGFAAGSCKELFCSDLDHCPQLMRGLPCPQHRSARPSLSALGVDCALLAQRLGWLLAPIMPQEQALRSQAPSRMIGLLVLKLS